MSIFKGNISMENYKKIAQFFTFLICLLFCGVILGLAQAQIPGRLDPTFGSGGKVIASILRSSTCNDVAVQSDGKIICVGESGALFNPNFAVVRFNPDGSFDPTFSDDGKLIVDFNSEGTATRSIGGSVAIQNDGKLVFAGTARISGVDNFAIVRLNVDGTYDDSFDNDGKLITSFGSRSEASSILIQPDGKIVASGSMSVDPNLDFAVARYNSDGSLDTTFDEDGKLTKDVSGGNDFGSKVLLQKDGKILVGGFTGGNSGILRYNQDGSLDNTFSDNGMAIFSVGDGNTILYSMALQTDGKIVFTGYGTFFVTMVGRLNIDGTFDTSFGSNGKLRFSMGRTGGYARAITIQPDGKILIAGHTQDFSSDKISLARLNIDGSFDTTFDGDGKVLTTFPGSSFAYAIAMQPDGKIVLAGRVTVNSDYQFVLTRYNGGCSVENSCFNSPVTGRVLTSENKPVRKAVITVVTNDGITKYAFSNPFGYYRFNELIVGDVYTFNVKAKGKTFQPVTIKLTQDNINGLNFISDN